MLLPCLYSDLLNEESILVKCLTYLYETVPMLDIVGRIGRLPIAPFLASLCFL